MTHSLSEILSDLPTGSKELVELRLHDRNLLRYLADHIVEAELCNGSRVMDATDCKEWLRQIADSLRVKTDSLANFADHRLRLRGRADLQSTCPRCGHIHEGDRECGFKEGGGPTCRCEMEVSA